ncbi:hypothetical protein Egran_00036 [Elaphomyces granulatus]|uniref:Uncharacterized protein n=1 Tax=Elaphomyces granulatus TaxID=519963 RepID=A0A232M760_9EURO|nr:hypothetical protein Egran_00036 [Elaphomyces granulatus]
MIHNVDNILRACLGASATNDNFNTVGGYFRTIVNNLGSKNDGVLDIDFRCTDPSLVLERNFPTDNDRTGSQKSKMTLHPVDLTRISGRIQNAADSDIWFLNDQLLIPVADIESSPSQSLAFTFYFSTKTIEIQQQLAGSNKLWADIIMKRVLSDTAGNPEKGRFKDAVRDWSLETLTRKRFSLFNIDPATITVMHELTHSIAIGVENAIGNHVMYKGKNVNGLKRVLEAAAGDVQGLTRNPDTLAYLALLLCMPWFKWWDTSKNPPVLDGVPRYNTFIDPENGREAFIIPAFMSNWPLDASGFTKLKNGPFSFT